jgi:hypothetical protein
MAKPLLLATLGVLAGLVLATGVVALAGDRFSDNGDGTVTDHERGLMWARNDNHGDIDWHQADKWVRYTFPYTLPVWYDNWRLPTLEELQSLVVEGRGYEADCGQWVKINPAINLSCGWIWTSQTGQLGPTATVFNFQNVYYYSVRKVQRRAYRALPVRDID